MFDFVFIRPDSDHQQTLLLTESATDSCFSWLDWCDLGVLRCLLKACWCCYCWRWWGSCWQQFVADLEAEVWSQSGPPFLTSQKNSLHTSSRPTWAVTLDILLLDMNGRLRVDRRIRDSSNVKDGPSGIYWFCLFMKEEIKNVKTKCSKQF